MHSLRTTHSALSALRAPLGEGAPPRRSARSRRLSSLVPLSAGFAGGYLLTKLWTAA
jgi:hypothetical protein